MHGCEVLLRAAFLYARMLRDNTHAKSRPRFLRDLHITLSASFYHLLQSDVHTRRPLLEHHTHKMQRRGCYRLVAVFSLIALGACRARQLTASGIPAAAPVNKTSSRKNAVHYALAMLSRVASLP